jgi:hypothetical protein
MKYFFTAILFVLVYAGTQAQDLLLGRGGWLWDTTATTFTRYDSLQNVYDLNHNLIQAVWRRYGNPTPGVWNFQSKKDYTYDGANNNTELFEFTWNGSAWQNYKHETFAYDVDGNVTLNIRQDFVGGAYQNVGKLEYVYVGGKMTDYNYYTWSSGAWSPTTWWQYHYNVSGLKDTALLYAYISGSWSLFSRYIYTYNGQGLLTSTLIQDWNSSSGNWENNFLDNTTYNANGKMLTYNRANWSGILWNWDKEWKYTYINDLYLTGKNAYNWNLINFSWYLTDSIVYHLDANNLCDYEVRRQLISSNWVNTDSVLHAYDAHSNTVHDVWHVWKNHLSNWRPYSQTYWWYLLGTTGIEEANSSSLKVYPNPTSEEISVEFVIGEPEWVTVILLNTNGQLVKNICNRLEAPGLVKLNTDISVLSAGVYLLQIRAGSQTFSRKVIVD